MLHQVGVSFVLYYDARKHKIKTGGLSCSWLHSAPHSLLLICVDHFLHIKTNKKLMVQRNIWNNHKNTSYGKYTERKYLLGRWAVHRLSLFMPSSDPTFICLVYIYFFLYRSWGHVVAQLVEALRYKLEGRRFDSQW